MKYLTLSQYRLADDYPLTADITDLILSRTILRAESDVDSFMAFDLRLGGFEPHTAWAQSQWDNKTLRTKVPNFPVPIRRALSYSIQVSNLTTSGAGFKAIINTNDVAYNTQDFYVEILPLQSVTYSLAPVLIQLGLRPPIVQMEYEAGFFLPVFGEPLLNDGSNRVYYAAHGFWATANTLAASLQPTAMPLPIPYVLYKNGVVISTGFTADTTEGIVTFTGANSSTDVITLDYVYQIPDAVRDATLLQTSWLLAQRALNRMGLLGIEQARSGDQQIKRHLNADAKSDAGSLCYDAAAKLEDYLGVPVA